MSYKKVNNIHSIVVIEKIKKILEAISIQIKLINEITTVVYIDDWNIHAIDQTWMDGY